MTDITIRCKDNSILTFVYSNLRKDVIILLPDSIIHEAVIYILWRDVYIRIVVIYNLAKDTIIRGKDDTIREKDW